jgi:hypothetical protein
MKRAAALALLLALPAFAADPFEGLKRLDRVAVTAKGGELVRGIVRSVIKGRLSIQIEGREGLTGTIVFERKSVAKVEKTGTATEEELKALAEPPQLDGLVEPEKKSETVEPAPPPPRPVLEAFPAGTWSRKLHDTISGKDAYLRSPEEREFLERFEEWREALEGRVRLARRRLGEIFPPDDGPPEATYGRLIRTLAVVGRELDANEREFVETYEALQRALSDLAAAK